ncbi:kinesin-like protein KIF11 [Coregonus clupeaformis]|uniref:kinesin-like protein KIF11 n=1 Tax=Coregonus clupeaformis TaxID=59861 RepID=UPI001BE0A987|nr:kinesin-like protein KIF11 [Coregonus clupeaformis]
MASNNLFNVAKKDEKGRNIQVVVRCRPFNNAERKSASHGVIDTVENRKEINVRTGGIGDKAARKMYTFDMVFGPAAKQIDVYKSVVCPILDEVISGYNCTVFAYGQTGTGKTFTMEGERSPNEEFTWEEDPLAGIIPRTLHQIFEKLSDNGTEFSVKVSLLEIYNEELFDLLSPCPDVTERLQLFDDPRNKRGVIIKGLEEITVHNKNEVYQILERGSAKRKTASTLMNAYSSRSHSVFSVTIHMKEITIEGEELVKIGKLNLVDLAGSENIGRSGAVDKRAREAGNINQSLLTLGRVITALVEKRPHVPYRESKLTRILQDSLGGRTKTSIIATVSPASINLEETLSTLEYANRAKNIMNKPEVNQKLTKRTLIKEYTEEIERLKRDLAATRDKNGVYLSSENYESMAGAISSQEEHITEYTEKIAAVEEELKRVTELFEDSKEKLDQCTNDLEEKNHKLEETHKDLQETKQKLTEEEFIVSELASTEEKLYTTADKLLTTVDVSTKDVSGLHAKLERKKKVEEHNSEIQISFADHMDAMFSQMQNSVEDQRTKHQSMLDSYKTSVEGLLTVNDKAFKGAMATVATSFCGIDHLFADGMTKCQAKMMEQETLCVEAKNTLHQVLEEHKLELEEVLVAQMLPGLSAIMAMNDSLNKTLGSHHALAAKMESMKVEMTSFFSGHAQDLAALRETATEGLGSLKTEHDNLKEQISRADKEHQTGMTQVIQCLQNQLNLLAMETQNNYAGLMSASDALQVPVQSLQQTLQTRCSAAENQTATQKECLESTTASLISEVQQTAQEAQRTVEECSANCSHLHSSLTQLGERSLQWCASTKDSTDSQAQAQLTVMRENTASAQTLLQRVEQSCEERVQEVSGQLKQQQGMVEEGLGALKEQTSLDQNTLEHHHIELTAHMEDGLGLVHSFLSEELKQDVPTGATPQRREFVYPRLLAKSKSRSELLDSLRHQQEELQAALFQCDTVEEEKQVDQDSLEDELSSYNDSYVTEPSYIGENLMCYENGRVPFFKQKKAGKKENKLLNRSKMAENETHDTPPRSKLPLRCQN